MPTDISEACFWDHCGECRDVSCGHICHRDEVFNPITAEWEEGDDDDY